MNVGSFLFIQGSGRGDYIMGDYDEIKVGNDCQIIGNVTYDGPLDKAKERTVVYINLNPRFLKTDWDIGDIHWDGLQLSIRLDMIKKKEERLNYV